MMARRHSSAEAVIIRVPTVTSDDERILQRTQSMQMICLEIAHADRWTRLPKLFQLVGSASLLATVPV